MTRYHGITGESYEQIVIDAGAIYTDFTDLGSPGTLLGATRGGSVFTRKPVYIDLPFEGVPGKVVGSKHLKGVEVTLEVSIVTLTDTNLPLAVPNADTSTSGGMTTITEEAWNAVDVHTLTSIALVAERANSGDPIIIILQNPICESDLSLPFKDKSETVTTWKFSAFYAADDTSTPPWSIGVPASSDEIGVWVSVADSTDKGAYSLDGGLTFPSDGTMPATAAWRYVKGGGGIIVAVRNNSNKMAYSLDGINWTEGSMPSTNNWISMAYGNGTFVAVATSSTGAGYSTDGINWSASVMPAGHQWRSVAWDGSIGKFVAVASSTSVTAHSADGITWTAGAITLNTYWRSIIGSGTGVFIAVNSSFPYTSIFARSTDGLNWSSIAGPSFLSLYSVAYGNGIFVAVAWGSALCFYSTDMGLTWQAGTMPATKNWDTVGYGGGRFVAFAYNSDTAAYSVDGINWTAISVTQRDYYCVNFA